MGSLHGRSGGHHEHHERGGRGPCAGVLLPLLMVLLLVAGLVVGGAVSYLLWARQGDTGTAADGCSRYRTVDVAVAPEMYDVATKALDEVAPECTRIASTMRSGGEVALGVSTGGALPDIWIPESRLLLSRAYLGAGSRVRMLAPSTARTPLLLVGGRHGPTVSHVGCCGSLRPRHRPRPAGLHRGRTGRGGPAGRGPCGGPHGRRGAADGGAVRPDVRGTARAGGRPRGVADDVQPALAPARGDHRAGAGQRAGRAAPA